MRKVIISATAAAMLMLLLASVALAAHYVYKAENPSTQDANWSGTENGTFYWWSQSITSVWWYTDSALRSDVDVAKNNWTTAVPPLTWLEVSETDADLVFKNESCGGFAACMAVTQYRHDVNITNASYIEKARVSIDLNIQSSTSDRRFSIAHEVGHFYGLDERYQEDPVACNNNEATVMDGIGCEPGLEGPAEIDKNRVISYWSEGTLADWTATSSVQYVADYTWKDRGWSEYEQPLSFYYWDGSNWVLYHNATKIWNIGVHQTTEDRTLEWTVDRRDYGAPAGWHSACGRPYFWQFNTVGTWACSPAVWVD